MNQYGLSQRLMDARPSHVSETEWIIQANAWDAYSPVPPQQQLANRQSRMIQMGEATQWSNAPRMEPAAQGLAAGVFIALLSVIVTAASIGLVVFLMNAKITFNFDLLAAGIYMLLGSLAGLPFVVLALAAGRR